VTDGVRGASRDSAYTSSSVIVTTHGILIGNCIEWARTPIAINNYYSLMMTVTTQYNILSLTSRCLVAASNGGRSSLVDPKRGPVRPKHVEPQLDYLVIKQMDATNEKFRI
jgi:hypothetical protein